VAYGYDAANQVISITYPSSRVVRFIRNTESEVESIWLDEVGGGQFNLVSNIDYILNGPESSWDYGNGLQHSKVWDQQYWLSSQNTPGVMQIDYPSYDANGNIEAMVVDGANQTFSYDPQDRLDTAAGNFGQRDYDHDQVGNRTSLLDDGALTNYSHETGSNRLTADTWYLYGHDANGNMTQKADNLGAGSGYNWTPDNRLESVHDLSTPAAPIAAYTYNALGQRVRKDVGGTTTGFVYSLGGEILAVTDGAGAVQKEFVYLNGRPVVMLPAPDPNAGPPPVVDEIVENGPETLYWVSKSDQKAYGQTT
ncbi:MAG: hypothetical protein V3R81_04890, partial [Gammaproteobacteria bacterium]